MKTVLLTGASGKIGSVFFKAVRDRYRFVLTDRVPPDYEVPAPHRFVIADLTSPGNLAALVKDIDTVVHLAAESDEREGPTKLIPANIVAFTYLMDKAVEAGCSRFVYASSLHVVHGYPSDRPIATDVPTWPVNYYGATKCYGESLCAVYAGRPGFSVIVLRIGDFEDYGSEEIANWFDRTAWLSPKDAVRLLCSAIDVRGVDYFVANGVSDNRQKRLDIAETRDVLNYYPEDDAFEVFGPAPDGPE